MSTIQTLFQQAQLAEAAYAKFDQVALANDALIAEGFSAAQATDFLTHWRVVDHLKNQDSGFSATVFESLDQPGQYALAIRGTEPGALLTDWPADLFGIGGQGIALRQAVDLYNYRQSLATTAGNPYQAAYLKTDLVETAKLGLASAVPGGYAAYKLFLEAQGFWVDGGTVTTLALGDSTAVLAGTDLEKGRLTASVQLGPHYDVVGHSLGGHLAMALGRLDYANVASIETFNPPFFDPGTSDKLSDRFFTQLQQLEATVKGAAVVADIFKPSQNYVVAGDRVHLIGANAPGVVRPIFTETENSNAISAHSITQTTDALAVYALFEQLDPSVNSGGMDSITSILRASSAIGGNSLEATVAALGKLFGKTYAAIETNRQDLYMHIGELQAAIKGKSFTEVSLTNMTAGEFRTIATDPDMVAVRYALKELNPFAVIGADYSSYQTSLSLYDTSTGNGVLSTEWLEDRSAMLYWSLLANTADTANLRRDDITGARDYEDRASGKKVGIEQSGVTWSSFLRGKTIFGKDQTDGSTESLNGSIQADHLYGGDGIDILTGNAGDDYLEGGAGNDILRGGAGNDTYRIDKNGGSDTIIDHAPDNPSDNISTGGDGQGAIVYKGQTLTGTLTQDGASRSLYHYTPDPTLVIRYIGMDGGRGNLLIMDPTGAKITLLDWKSGELGLTLSGTAATTQPATDLLGTDLADNGELPTATPHNGTLVATAASQKVYGLGGADLIQLGLSGDIGYGGNGNDILQGGSGNDLLDGGIGDDMLQGGAGDDVIDGGDGLDFIDGGAGSDVINGGDGDDMIFGGGDFAMAFNSRTDYDRFAIDGTPLLQRDSSGRFVLPSGLVGSTGVDEIGDELASILLRQHFQKSRRWRDIEPAYRDAVIERRREG